MTLPILQYGTIAYSTNDGKAMQTLDSINNQSLRLALGAFRTSPIDSLLALGNQKTLEQMRIESHMNYVIKTLANRDNPVHEFMVYVDPLNST